MAEVRHIVTLAGRNYFANVMGGKLSSAGISQFKIGVDGYTIVNGQKVPKVPSEDRTMLEAEEAGHFVFSKALDSTKLSVTDRILTVTAEVLETEANGEEFFEIGLYSDTGTLVIYGTYPGILKQASFKMIFTIKIKF